MKTKLLIKSLLVAAGLSMGMNAWAAENQTYEITSSESCYTHKGEADVTHNGASLECLYTLSGQLRVGNTTAAPVKLDNDNSKVAFYKFDLATIKAAAGEIVNATFSGTLTGSGDGKYIANILFVGYNPEWSASTLTWNSMEDEAGSAGGTVTDGASFQALGSTDTWSSGTAFPYTYNIDVKNYLQSAIDEDKDYVTIAVIHNSVREAKWATTAKLSVEKTTNIATTCTIKYQDAGGNDLKTARIFDTFAGETITASDADMASFTSTDGNTKYTYVSGNDSRAAVADATSNVITLVFSATAKFTYTVNAVSGGNTIKEIANSFAFAGDAVTVHWNKYINVGGQWYVTNAYNSHPWYGKVFTEAAEHEVVYSKANIDYFFEVEELHKSASSSFAAVDASNADRFSNGLQGRVAANRYVYTDKIGAGVYDFTIWARSTKSTEQSIPLFLRSDDGNLTDLNISVARIGGQGELTYTIVIPEGGAAVAINNNTSYNSNLELDYIVMTKKTVSVSVAADKEFATFNSDYALDFANVTDIIAYTAQVSADGSTVTMTKVDGAVPANTGLLIRKAASTSAEVPVVASAAAVTNEFIAVAADNCDEGQEYKTVKEGFILATVGGEQGFYKANSTDGTKVGKGKAYLPATGAAGARLTVKFGDEATGISDMRVVTVDNAVYNLNGVRVSQPTKGLYIVNGKKMVIK